jgi:thioesterase domain-containing protein
VVHPGALPSTVYRPLADTLARSTDTGPATALWVVDLDRVPEYTESALHGGQPRTNIADMATTVERELRAAGAVAADTRWVLAGWSFGGVIAHELIERLGGAEKPRRLVVLDSIAPVPDYTKDDGELDPAMLLPWFAMFLGAKRGVTLPLADRDTVPTLADVLDAAVASGVVPADTSEAGLSKVYRVFEAGLRRNNLICTGFRARPARVPVTLVRPEGSLLDTPDPLGWEQLADDLKVVGCPGDHYSMLSDAAAVDTVAALLRDEVAPPVPMPGDRREERSFHHV